MCKILCKTLTTPLRRPFTVVHCLMDETGWLEKVFGNLSMIVLEMTPGNDLVSSSGLCYGTRFVNSGSGLKAAATTGGGVL